MQQAVIVRIRDEHPARTVRNETERSSQTGLFGETAILRHTPQSVPGYRQQQPILGEPQNTMGLGVGDQQLPAQDPLGGHGAAPPAAPRTFCGIPN